MRTHRALVLIVLGVAVAAAACGSNTPTGPTSPSASPSAGAVTLAALTLETPTVAGGASVQGRATLSESAPTGGTIVTLTTHAAVAVTAHTPEGSHRQSVTAPASIAIPAGAASATFMITTDVVSAAADVTITGSAGGQTQTATLHVMPAATTSGDSALAALSVDASFVGGQTTRGTVTLTSAAPEGGLVVTLASGRSEAQVPSSITIPPGALSMTFTITSQAVMTQTRVQITATAGGESRTAELVLRPSAVPTLTEIRPQEGARGQSVAVTLSGTGLVAGRTTVSVGGEQVAVSGVTVSSSTGLTATFAIAGGATVSDRKVTVTTPEGTSNALAFTVRDASSGPPPPSGSETFTFTGGSQTFTVPAGVTQITIEAFGAQGGEGLSNGLPGGAAGLGGSIRATLTVTPGTLYQVNVGGPGSNGAFGVGSGAGGGGASDVRTGGNTLGERVLVAGGGGGGGLGSNFTPSAGGAGGAGGGPVGAAGGDTTSGAGGGTGGTQSAGGSGGGGGAVGVAGALGQGGDGAGGAGAAAGGFNGGGNGRAAGGGGGGYYGGGGGGQANETAGGGGGSSFATTGATSVTHTQGNHTGNGQVVITW